MAFSIGIKICVDSALPPSIHTGHVFTTLPAASEQLSPLTIDEHVIHFFFPSSDRRIFPLLPRKKFALSMATFMAFRCRPQKNLGTHITMQNRQVNFSTKLTHPETAELLDATAFLTRLGTLHSTGVWPALRQLRNKSFTMFFRIIFNCVDVTPVSRLLLQRSKPPEIPRIAAATFSVRHWKIYSWEIANLAF